MTSTRGRGGPAARVLCLIGCAAPPVLQFRQAVAAAIADGWRVWPVLTPAAARWLDAVPGEFAEIGRLAGHEVRCDWWMPGEGSRVPRAEAVLVAPATANTVNKCAAGISDTLALGLLNDAIGRGLPVVLATATGGDHAHPAYRRSVRLLQAAGVGVIDGPQRVPGAGGQADPAADGGPSGPMPWCDGLAALAAVRRPACCDLAASASGAP
jgi:hypothetical protein